MTVSRVLLGDCVEQMRTLADASVDAIVTDPPYGLGSTPDASEVLRHWLNGGDYVHRGGGFMGKSWDSFVPGPAVWREALRVLKPGGHLLAFFGTRTMDLGSMAIRLAGFEVRDTLAWMYGSGFPKSHDVSKAVDKLAGAERPVVGTVRKSVASMGPGEGNFSDDNYEWNPEFDVTAPATDDAKTWEGWGTALKPAFEPVVVARKPLVGTVAANVLSHGTGALNVDGCRIEGAVPEVPNPRFLPGNNNCAAAGRNGEMSRAHDSGRWPANVLLDEVAAAVLDEQTGGASRFFYCAKASQAERNAGLDAFNERPTYMVENGSKTAGSANGERYERTTTTRNPHPTVKPVDVMRWLCRLVTPPGGLILDPFLGSGTTGIAAAIEGFEFVGIEREQEYIEIAEARIAWWTNHPEAADDLRGVLKLAHQPQADVIEAFDLFSAVSSNGGMNA